MDVVSYQFRRLRIISVAFLLSLDDSLSPVSWLLLLCILRS